jgi:hypothetical protein
MLLRCLKSFVAVLFLAAAAPCAAQQQSSCTIPSILYDAYARDVADLAIKRMWATGHADTAQIVIPAPQLDSIWGPLSAIFSLDTALQADSVFSHRCIHTGNNWNLANGRQVIVSVNDSFSWTGAWTIGNTPTGYGALDSFCDRYGYTFLQNYHVGPAHYVLLHTSERDINDEAFADSLATFDGVLRTGRPGWMGDGNYLTYSRDTAAHLSFSMGWDDCASGCVARKTWHYTVTTNCFVTLDSVTVSPLSGAPLPALTSCGLQPNTPTAASRITGTVKSIRLYPNPASGNQLWIEGLNANETNRFTITDGWGRRLLEGAVLVAGPLDISKLPAGAYLLHLRGTGDNYAVQPFMRQ